MVAACVAYICAPPVSSWVAQLLRVDPEWDLGSRFLVGVPLLSGFILFAFSTAGVMMARRVTAANRQVAACIDEARQALAAGQLDEADRLLSEALAIPRATKRDEVLSLLEEVEAARPQAAAVPTRQQEGSLRQRDGMPFSGARDSASAAVYWVIFVGAVVSYLVIVGFMAKARAARDANIFCPHCRYRGGVRTKDVRVKRGIDGTKAAAALLTGGLSIFVVGLSHREAATEAYCSNCGCVWRF
jgi:hypothetical protein